MWGEESWSTQNRRERVRPEGASAPPGTNTSLWRWLAEPVAAA